MQTSTTARWSRYLIFFVLAVLPLERIPALDITHPVTATIRLSQVAGALLIAINLPLLWQRRCDLLKGPWRWLVLFLAAITLSAVFAADHKRALTVLVYTIFVALLAWVFSLRFERDQLARYIGIVTVSALTACAIGYYQFFGDLFGLPISATGLRPEYTQGVFGFPRIQSTALEPLYFADYLLLPSALLVTLVAVGWKRRWPALALIPILAVVWLTVSRAAIVALIFVLIVGLILAIARKKFRRGGIIVGLAVLSMALAIGLISFGSHNAANKNDQSTKAVSNFSKQATNLSDGESAESRSITRHLALTAFKQNPILGLGPGNFGVYAQKGDPSTFTAGSIVNNEPLEILAETGLVGSLFFAAFIVSLALLAFKYLRRFHDSLPWMAAFGLSLALVAIGIQYQTFSTLYITHIWVTIGLLIGVINAPLLKKSK